MHLITDADVDRLATPERSRDAMRAAVVAAWRGELVAPPRVAAALGERRLTFTCGARPGDWLGFRSYVAPGDGDDEQVVVVQDEQSGRVRAVAVGRALGPRRVGAIGAVALEALAPPVPDAIALLGTGNQAWHQLWALPDDVRALPVRVYSRRATSREDFARRARAELGLDAHAVESPEAAADGAGIVVLATNSPVPVLPLDAIRPGAYVATLGPKQVGRAEFAPELAAGAALVASDSPAQIAAYDPPNVLAGTAHEGRLVHLGAIVSGAVPVPDGTRVFFSVGLAGTEAWLLNAVTRP